MGLPKQGKLQNYKFDKELTEAQQSGEAKEPYADYAMDDCMSQVLFIDPTRKRIEHHMLNWRFDVSKFDTEGLATLSKRFAETNTFSNPKVARMSVSSNERSQRLKEEQKDQKQKEKEQKEKEEREEEAR